MHFVLMGCKEACHVPFKDPSFSPKVTSGVSSYGSIATVIGMPSLILSSWLASQRKYKVPQK